MKKIVSFGFLLLLVLTVAACGSQTPENENGGEELGSSLESILDQIYQHEGVSQEFKDYAEDGLMTTEITEENMEYHLGKSGLEFEAAIASVPLISPSAFELCLVRVGEGADIEQLKQDIRDNVDPFKWVCVGVSEENIIVDNIGDVVILIMSDNEAQALHEAFLELGN